MLEKAYQKGYYDAMIKTSAEREYKGWIDYQRYNTMTNCTNCDQVNDLWDENRKLQKVYNEVCTERDKLKEENKKLYLLCNKLLAEQRGDYNDGLPKVEGKLLTENDIF